MGFSMITGQNLKSGLIGSRNDPAHNRDLAYRQPGHIRVGGVQMNVYGIITLVFLAFVFGWLLCFAQMMMMRAAEDDHSHDNAALVGPDNSGRR
jgi:hypothetical protein